LSAQEGQLDKENFGISKLITSLHPMGRGDETYLPGAAIAPAMSAFSVEDRSRAAKGNIKPSLILMCYFQCSKTAFVAIDCGAEIVPEPYRSAQRQKTE